ncbi:MAG: minor extracellular serine protease Vpr, partial [Gaiellaceae bacterium]|nr:minor extracellular serine protease Vpr [Gaiellaceae bacterium]
MEVQVLSSASLRLTGGTTRVGRLKRGRIILIAAVAALSVAAPAGARSAARVEVVVTLKAPALAAAPLRTVARADARVDVDSVASRRYVRSLASGQDALVQRIKRAIPSAQVRWRYHLVLNGLAVVVPRSSLGRLSRLPGVARVDLATGYAPSLDISVPLIGAPTLWGPSLSTAGQGMKIGIVDDGLDASHPFFSPAGYAYPAGFPKGDTRYTTPKVIVARNFPSASALAVHRDVPFDPENSEHATHVSGIAAGDDGTLALFGGTATTLAGVAPRAYLGNYKVMSVPTPQFGIDGNSPEIAAGIEAAVADGMDVINLSLGEPEVTQSRDIVVRAIDAATKLGVVVTVAAGNDYGDFGDGSINSPGSAPGAISVAASGTGKGFGLDQIAGFSSGGPTPISLALKPDVTAPGVQILSSLPKRAGSWAAWQGTSMAAPHVAGAAALLLQRHPTWTPAQVKSALVLTGKPVYTDGGATHEVSPLREGGGRIDLVTADNPLVFASPTSLSLGLVRPGAKLSREVALADAGGGAGTWTAAVALSSALDGVTVTVPTQVTVPGAFVLGATASSGAREGDEDGFVVLRNAAGLTRRIPFWLHLERPRLGSERHTTLKRPGVYTGNTRGKAARVATYRYPTKVPGAPSLLTFPGPEQVFRFKLGSGVANAGVVVLSTSRANVVPHVVVAGDENRLTGYAGLPINIDPYRNAYGLNEGVAGVDLPQAGSYDAVFDTPSGG